MIRDLQQFHTGYRIKPQEPWLVCTVVYNLHTFHSCFFIFVSLLHNLRDKDMYLLAPEKFVLIL